MTIKELILTLKKKTKKEYIAFALMAFGLCTVLLTGKNTEEQQETMIGPSLDYYSAGVHNAINSDVDLTEPIISDSYIPTTGQAPLKDTPVLFEELTYIELYDIAASEACVVDIEAAIVELTEAIDSDTYTDAANEAMTAEITRLQEIVSCYNTDIERYTTWEQEYYYSAKVWEYLKQHGYSDAAAAGIIGNMMTECGGHTMKLNPKIYNPTGTYYGICQWSKKYYPQIHGKSFEAQLDFLEQTIRKEYKTFGKLYKKGFTFDQFVSMTSPEDAAIAFAKVYERCGSGSYSKRQRGARTAYEYFTK